MLLLAGAASCSFDGSGVGPNGPSDGGNGRDPDALGPRVDAALPQDAGRDCTAPGEVCNFSWARRITIDNRGITERIEDVPVLVVLDASRFDYATTRPGGEDLRFMIPDFTQELAYEIEHWNPGGTSFVWVKVPRIEAEDKAGPEFWMIYGNPLASPGQRPADVWTNGFVSVHHFNGNLADATGRGHDGVSTDAPTPVANGVVAGAMSFDGQRQYLELPREQDFDFTTNMSISMWIRVQRFDYAWQTLAAKGDSAWRLHRNDRNTHLGFDNNAADGPATNHSGNTKVDDQVWHHVFGTYNGQKKEIYIDGVQDRSYNYTRAINRNDAPVYIGENSGAAGRWFYGEIDEVRIAEVPRSPSWITAEFRSMKNDGFVTIGEPERL